MTNTNKWLAALVAAVLFALTAGIAIGGSAGFARLIGGVSRPQAMQYHCPMHPTVVQDRKGSCPICSMDLVPIEDRKHETAAAAEADKPTEYHCPMHPTVVQDKKGSCPICGMDLVPIEKGETERACHGSAVPGLATVTITPEIRQRMGLRLGTVEKRPLAREVRTSARIVIDETRQYLVNTKIEGWVEKLFVNVTGQDVKKGDPLLTIYSPELLSAQEEYLIALKAEDTPGGAELLAAARRRLQLWDISDGQIEGLAKTREAEKTLTLFAPADGVVLDKNILAGQKIMPDDSLLKIADLRKVWADADIYQSDLPIVTVGTAVEVTLPFWPGKAFRGKVAFITPTLDPGTRTARARLEIENPDLLLKPNMYANARLSRESGEALAIPETAVMRTGERTYAFKDGGEGRLIPVAIRVGARSGEYFEVVEGLKEGDKVVTSANFLVDSESSLKAALSAMSGGDGEGNTENAEAENPHSGHGQ